MGMNHNLPIKPAQERQLKCLIAYLEGHFRNSLQSNIVKHTITLEERTAFLEDLAGITTREGDAIERLVRIFGSLGEPSILSHISELPQFVEVSGKVDTFRYEP